MASSEERLRATPLTDNQLGIMQAIANGKSYEEIGLDKQVTQQTLRNTLAKIYRVLSEVSGKNITDHDSAVVYLISTRAINIPPSDEQISAFFEQS